MSNLEKESAKNVSIIMNLYHRENERSLSFLPVSNSLLEADCGCWFCISLRFYRMLRAFSLERAVSPGCSEEILRGSNTQANGCRRSLPRLG